MSWIYFNSEPSNGLALLRIGVLLLFPLTFLSAAGASEVVDVRSIDRPKRLVSVSGGILIGARNGLFFLQDPIGLAKRLSSEESVNDILANGDGFLVGTDSGLFAYAPNSTIAQWKLIGNYKRSVREIHRYSDYEFFLATQDGMFYLTNENLRQIGKNTELNWIAGKFGDDVVLVGDTEIGLGNGELISYYDCRSQVTAVVNLTDSVLVGTLDGICRIENGNLVSIQSHLAIRDLVSRGSRLLAASSSGLHWIEISGNAAQAAMIIGGDFFDLQEYSGGILALGAGKAHLLGQEGNLLPLVELPGTRKSWRIRELREELIFCLNTGILFGHPDKSNAWEHIQLQSEVHDAMRFGKSIVVATSDGLAELKPQSSSWMPFLSLSLSLTLAFIVAICLVAWRLILGRPVVFVSYRRADSQATVGRICDRLRIILGKGRVRVDVDEDEFPKGLDFRDETIRNLKESIVVLVVIGPEWLSARDHEGEQRLFATVDLVRLEIEKALEWHKRIIPVLLNNAIMPKAGELPHSIERIAYLQSHNMRQDPDFESDFRKLVSAIRKRGYS